MNAMPVTKITRTLGLSLKDELGFIELEIVKFFPMQIFCLPKCSLVSKTVPEHHHTTSHDILQGHKCNASTVS